jgi:hypothetical protein
MGQMIEAHAKANRRKKTVSGHLKQEHLGDFGVGIDDSASWRRFTIIDDKGATLFSRGMMANQGGKGHIIVIQSFSRPTKSRPVLRCPKYEPKCFGHNPSCLHNRKILSQDAQHG